MRVSCNRMPCQEPKLANPVMISESNVILNGSVPSATAPGTVIWRETTFGKEPAPRGVWALSCPLTTG